MTVKRFMLGLLLGLLFVICLTPAVQAAVYNVVDAGSAWPSDVFGVYTENGTNNGRPCYEGPNGFWLYHGQWSGIDTWFIGNIKGETEINSSGVRFFYCGSQMSPPLDTYFDHTNSALGGVKVTASAGSPPSAPVSLMSSGATGSSYVCNWSDVSNATGYKLEVSTSSSFTDLLPGYNPKTIVIPAGTPLSERPVTATISGLSPGTGYYTRIRSYNGFGDSANTNAPVITTIPEIPVVQSASAIYDTGFQANWTPRSGTLSYHLYVSAAADFSSYILNNMTAADNHYLVTGLSPNTTYYYKVSASNAAGDSGQSAIMSVTTAPAKPADVNTSAITSNSFTANWGAAAGASGYYLDVASDTSFTALLPAYTGLNVGNVTSCSVTGLAPYTQYYLRLSSYSINGTSSPSTTYSVQTLPVAAEVTTGASVETDVFSAGVVGSITSLGVPSAGEHGFCWNTTGNPTITDDHTSYGPVTSTGQFSGTLSGLSASTPYYVRAYATNEAGTVYGQVVTFTTLAANHAPVLHGTSVVLDGTDENTTSSTSYVYTFLNASDEDLPANILGIAIDGQSGRGAWQYSLDGSSWISFGTVSPSASLLLNINALIRYIPDGTNGETASFSFRAWDNTSGSEGEKVDTSTNGGYSAFSSVQGEASLTVVSINDAPVLVPTGSSMVGTNEDTVSDPTPSIFLLNASDTDLPPNSLGIAVTNITGRGTWQYTEDGAAWLDITGVSPSTALLFGSAVQIRYCPDGMNGETATISYRAWDSTSGSQSTYADTTVNGGTTSFSTAQDTSTLIVTDINDAPALVSGPFIFDPTDLVTVSHAYQVSEMAEVSDVDLGALSGIAVTAAVGSGMWQYSADGVSWTNFGTVSPTSALLLSSDRYIHYIPDTSSGAETAFLSFRAWDQTSGSTGAKSDITTNGGTTAFSTNDQTASVTVTIPVYSISGQISTSGSGLAGAVLSGLPGSPVTDSAGNYSAEVNYGWSGTVTPQLTGYTFTPASRTYTSIAADQPGHDYSALINTYDISVAAAPDHGGTAACVTANGIDIPYGTQVTVTAEANSGWKFINWTEGGTEVSNTASYTFTAAADRDLVANFSFDPVQIVPVPTDEVVSIVLPPGITPQDVEYHISVAEGVADPKIQLAVEDGSAVAPQLTITTPSQVELHIAAGTEITGPAGWDGLIGLPVISSVPSKNLGGDHFVIQVGLDSGSLNFTEPVQLFAPGQGNKEVKVIRGGTVYDVTEKLDVNSLDAARAVLKDGTTDAKYVGGNNLYIWTIRFSEFVAYTERSSGGDITFGPNGGQISDQGVIVYIPGGALNGSASIRIQQVIDSSGLTPVNGRLLSSVFEVVSSHNEKLDKPARITLPFDKTKMDKGFDRISLCYYDEDTQSWQEADNVLIVGDTVSGDADRFGRFAVIAFKTPAEDEDDKTEEEPVASVGFKDIKGHWAENNIMELVGRGCVSGYPDNSFRPERNISRAEFAVMLVQAFDLNPREGKVFSDTRDHWAKYYIATANGYGIINGYSEQYFGPDDLVSREQMAVMISLAAGLAAGDGPTGFTDQDNVSVWALPYVKAASDNHIMNGYPDGSFVPAGKATRAEAVTIIVNALKK